MIGPFIAIDTETGGLDYERNPLVQIGLTSVAELPCKGTLLENFEWIRDSDDSLDIRIAPYGEGISSLSALLVHPETVYENKTRASREEAADGILEFLRSVSARADAGPFGGKKVSPYLVGHNLAFDVNFLEHQLFRPIGMDGFGQIFFGRQIDTKMLLLFRHLHSGLSGPPRSGLEGIVREEVGSKDLARLERDGLLHDALNDARWTLALLATMTVRYREQVFPAA